MILTETTLGKICESGGGEIQTGPFGSQLHKSDYQEEGTPVVMPSDIVEGSISTDDVARVGNGMVEKLSSHKLGEGDIVFGRRGDIGRCALVTKRSEGWLCGTGCLRVTPGNGEVDSRFLFYYLSRPSAAKWLENHAVGATMANLNTSILESVPVQLPPLPVQCRIAGILSAYDDLIENNARRIALLEEMAQAVYREWFVELRFPGHADAEMRETEALGPVPAGWEVAALGDLAESPRNRVKPQEEVEPDVPYFGLGDLPKESIALSEWGRTEDAGSTKYVFGKGDILFGKIRPYFHKVGPAPVAGICSTDAIVIRPISSEYFGLVLGCVSSEEFVAHATQTSSGTKMPRAKWKILEDYPVAVPPTPFLEQFDDTMRAFVEQIHTLIHKNRRLRRTRDLLLPRLVSGEVAVDVMDETAKNQRERIAS